MKFLFFIFCLTNFDLLDSFDIKFVKQIYHKKPAFINTYDSPIFHGTKDMFISSFGFPTSSSDEVRVVTDLKKAIRTNTFDAGRIGGNVVWPNEVDLIGNELFVSGGFLLPFKSGSIKMLDYSEVVKKEKASWTTIAQPKNGFFHRVLKVNLLNKAAKGNDDGYRYISCKGQKSFFGNGNGELVYFDKVQDSYEMRVLLGNSCDFFIDTIDINNDGIAEFIVPLFFEKKLMLMWTTHPEGDYTKPEYIRTRNIDIRMGSVFDIELTDLDNDGKLEILVTNHEAGKNIPLPAVYCYKILPPQRTNGQRIFTSSVSEYMESVVFEKHIISEGFQVIDTEPGSAAPGKASAIKIPGLKYPAILVSEDGGQKADLLVREGPSWKYKKITIHDCKGTVGKISSVSFGDGITHIFIPCYTKDYIAYYQLSP
jgi:hypothetical protein